MNGLLESLPQQVLAAFRIGDEAVYRQYQVVGDQRVGGGKEAQAALNDGALVLGEAILAFPQRDVGGHIDFLRHPVVSAAIEIFLPCPVVLERHQLVQVGAAVDHGLLIDRDPFQAFLVGNGVQFNDGGPRQLQLGCRHRCGGGVSWRGLRRNAVIGWPPG